MGAGTAGILGDGGGGSGLPGLTTAELWDSRWGGHVRARLAPTRPIMHLVASLLVFGVGLKLGRVERVWALAEGLGPARMAGGINIT